MDVFLYFPEADIALDELEEIVERVLSDDGEVTGSGIGTTGGNLDIEIWGVVDVLATLRTLASEFMRVGVPGEAEFHLVDEGRRVTLVSLAVS